MVRLKDANDFVGLVIIDLLVSFVFVRSGCHLCVGLGFGLVVFFLLLADLSLRVGLRCQGWLGMVLISRLTHDDLCHQSHAIPYRYLWYWDQCVDFFALFQVSIIHYYVLLRIFLLYSWGSMWNQTQTNLFSLYLATALYLTGHARLDFSRGRAKKYGNF